MLEIKEILNNQRKFYNGGNTLSIDFRINVLKRLRDIIKNKEEDILEALRMDLGKSRFEAYATEMGIVLEELNLTIRKLRSWAKPERKRTPIMHFLSSSYVYKEPYGVVLIMSPWNYPFQLTMAPLIGAIASGNCVMVKPSAYSVETTKIICSIIKEVFDLSHVEVVKPFGGREDISKILDEKYDYIFFTGSVNVGKIVMEKASKHLTPITLELGGKSPCIVDSDADIDLAAKRIVWGKFLNAGQTCVAPDYLLAHSDIKDMLLEKMCYYIKKFYGEDPSKNPEYPKIITHRQWTRLIEYLNEGDIICGGESYEAGRYIAPTIIDNATFEFKVMKDEIFGPIMPVITFNNIDEVIKLLKDKPKPLALYYFSESKESQKKVLEGTTSGGGCINDTVIHVASSNITFGGVGESGMGSYHGKASFDTFTHYKSIIKKSNIIDVDVRYPPFKNKISLLKKIMK
ncbi:aldehyde dehydrogenase [Clostridium sp.]|uniref:aldehyde dehydrogenase n=1 Tax=Clostridium sp. TaxID=1506 RepID=UPI0034643D01